jgi:hypothetical protein
MYGQPGGDRSLLDGQRGCHSDDARSWSALEVKRIRHLKVNYPCRWVADIGKVTVFLDSAVTVHLTA